jgi:hypothetical protein
VSVKHFISRISMFDNAMILIKAAKIEESQASYGTAANLRAS